MVLILLLMLVPVKLQDISPLLDTKTLSELPLEKLLQVKNTFEVKHVDLEAANEVLSSGTAPEALALHAKHSKPHNDRGGYHYHYEEEYSKKSGKKSVQSIFQISVTTLAFLAFGGYLLCLLVQAIKGKTTTMTVETSTAAAVLATFLKRPTRVRRRTTRRPLRLQRPYPRRPKRDVWPEADPEQMYWALVHVSEAYSQYHTIDYKRFNFTTSSYW